MHFAHVQLNAVMVQFFKRFSAERAVADRPKWRDIPMLIPMSGLPVTLRLRHAAPKSP